MATVRSVISKGHLKQDPILKRLKALEKQQEKTLRIVAELSKDRLINPHIIAGDHALAQKRYKTAEGHYRKALEIHPLNTTALTGLGNTEVKRGNLKEGKKYYLKAHDPEQGDLLASLGEIAIRENDLKNASALFRSMIYIDPKNVDPHIKMVEIAMEEEKFEKAKKHLKKVLELEPGHETAIQMLNSLKADDDLSVAATPPATPDQRNKL